MPRHDDLLTGASMGGDEIGDIFVILAKVVDITAPRRMRPVAAQIGDNERGVFGQRRRYGRELHPMPPRAMQQDQQRPMVRAGHNAGYKARSIAQRGRGRGLCKIRAAAELTREIKAGRGGRRERLDGLRGDQNKGDKKGDHTRNRGEFEQAEQHLLIQFKDIFDAHIQDFGKCQRKGCRGHEDAVFDGVDRLAANACGLGQLGLG